MMIYPVILAGGSGTRLWPLSRKSYPKQFANLIGEETPFQESLLRTFSTKKIIFEKPTILTNNDFRFIVKSQADGINLDLGKIIIEPQMRGTAPAIIAATLLLSKKNKNPLILVTPSDHIIHDLDKFHKSVLLGVSLAKNGEIVTFGTKPKKPSTAFGYLEAKINKDKTFKVTKFIEKPDITKAKKFINLNNFFWNTGIFLFSADDMINSYKNYCPEIFNQVKKSIQKGKFDLDFFRLDTENWSNCPDISIDYAILEKSTNVSLVPFKGYWSDIGSWDSLWNEKKKNPNDVVLSKDVSAFKCKSSLLLSHNENQHLVGLGLKDIIAVVTSDAVLVANMKHSQEVKNVVSSLKKNKINQAENSSKIYRPWGWYESLIIDKFFQVKKIHVFPNAMLSLQKHKFRSEHWIIVEGVANVTIGKKVNVVKSGESVFVPKGELHRLHNPSEIPMVLIEVQIGTYFGEDDIIRLEDIYDRIGK